MTNEDIIRMAKEAWGEHHEIFWFNDGGIERFAALVRADEREACARVCEEMHLLHFAGPWKKQAAAIRARSKK